jgi:hypothetical protein
MKTFLRSLLAVLLGIILGSAVNTALILASPQVIPPPAGVDVNNVESMRASIHLFEPKHFLFPFLAHALGTLVGATVAGLVAASRRMAFALGLGMFFLLGGIAAAFMIPAPKWFLAVDLLLAYLPMAWLGGTLAGRLRGKPTA